MLLINYCHNQSYLYKSMLALTILITSCNAGDSPNTGNIVYFKGAPVNGQYTDFVVDKKSDKLYVSDSFQNQIHIFDTVNDSFLQSINIGSSPTRLAISGTHEANANYLFVVTNNGTEISTLNLGDFSRNSIELDSGSANSMVVDNNNRLLYVGVSGIPADTGVQASRIRVFDIDTLIEQASLNTASQTQGYLVGYYSELQLLLTADYNSSSPNIFAWDIADPAKRFERWSGYLFGGDNALPLAGQIRFNKMSNGAVNKMYIIADGSVSHTGYLQSYTLAGNRFSLDDVIMNVEYRPIAMTFNSNGDRIIVAHDNFLQNEIVLDAPRHSGDVNDIHIFDTQDNSLLLTVPLTQLGIDRDFRIKADGIIADDRNNIYLLLTNDSVDNIATLRLQ